MQVNSAELRVSSIDELMKSSRLLSTLPGYIGLKDHNSRIFLVNNNVAALTGYASPQCFLDKEIFDEDLNCQASELMDEFIEQDQRVFTSKKVVKELIYAQYANGQPYVFYNERYPIVNSQNEVIAIWCAATDITNINIIDFSMAYTQLTDYYLNGKSKRQFIINLSDDSDDTDENELSKRQYQCIYYLLRGYSAKQIANQLGISSRTVETHIHRLKVKYQCTSKSQLIETVLSHGFLNTISSRFLFDN